jgi:hypothetical protein
MNVVRLYLPSSGRAELQRERLLAMRDDALDRMRRRSAVEPVTCRI